MFSNMKRYLIIYVVSIALCTFGTLRLQATAFSDIPAAYTKAMADSAYAEADYATAIHIYEQLIAMHGESSVVYYNLGGAYYKMDDIAHSILNYERALLMDPSNEDIQFNLELVRSKAVDKDALVGELFYVRWYRNFSSMMSADSWSRVAILCFIILILNLTLFIFSKKSKTKKIIFIFALLSLLCSVLTGLIASNQTAKLERREYAIIMDPSVVVRSTPSEIGTELFVLHEGKKVKINDDSMKAWKEIELEDGNIGWLSAESIEKI